MTPWGILANILSSKFTWTEHIEYVSKKINQCLGLLRRIKSLLPRSASILFFKSLFLDLWLCRHCLGGMRTMLFSWTIYNSCRTRLPKLYQTALFTHLAADALEALGWLTLGKRRLFHLCLYVYKRVNKISAHSMDLLANKDVHGYDTRRKDNLRLPRVRKNWGKQRTHYQITSSLLSVIFIFIFKVA